MLTRLSLFLTLFLIGCSTNRQTFEGHDADQVWTAMVAVAKTPDYTTGDPTDRWTVRENEVWVDQAENRIEIFRRVERILYRPASNPLHEDREWKLQVVLEKRDPPTVVFKARNLGVPSHAWDEADRYFAEVRDLLSGGSPKAEEQPGD